MEDSNKIPSSKLLTHLEHAEPHIRYIYSQIATVFTMLPGDEYRTFDSKSLISGLTNGITTKLLPELVDIVIDHLHDDAKALRSCSLVCKDWLHSSRYHLFSKWRAWRDRERKFLSLLQDMPFMRTYIRTLQLTLGDFVSLTRTFVPQLPNLHTLEVGYRVRRPGKNYTWIKPPRTRVSTCTVTTLIFNEISLASGTCVWGIIALFPLVTELEFFDLRTGRRGVHVPTNNVDLRLTHLALDSFFTTTNFVPYIRKTSSMKTLRSLGATINDEEDKAAIQVLLQDLAPNLHYLRLRFLWRDTCNEGDQRFEKVWKDLNIAGCSSLQYISVYFSNTSRCGYVPGHNYACHWRRILALLWNLPTNTTRGICIGFHAGYTWVAVSAFLHCAPWGKLNRRLRQFDQLEVLRFDGVDGTCPLYQQVKVYVRTMLPSMEMRGILKVM